MGGMTALAVCTEDTRPVVCAVFDPWLFAYFPEINSENFKVKIPLVVASSELFHPSLKSFNSWETLMNLFR